MNSALTVIVDFVALVGFLCLAASGAVMRWSLPPGSEGQGFRLGKSLEVKLQGQTLLGWDRNNWTEIHFWIAVVFACVMVIHFVLSWSNDGGKQ